MDRSVGKKAIHRWKQASGSDPRVMSTPSGRQVAPTDVHPGRDDRFRFYVCDRCGAGPVRVDILVNKANINKVAVKSGILSDCNSELVRRILDA